MECRYAIMQVNPQDTAKMINTFRRIVGDSQQDDAAGEGKWSAKEAAKASKAAAGGGSDDDPQQLSQDDEAWVTALESDDMKDVSNNQQANVGN